MNPVLAEIYSTVVPSAPYLIAAYALLWIALLIYVFAMWRRSKAAEQRISVLEEALADLEERSARSGNPPARP